MYSMHLRCVNCDTRLPATLAYKCNHCGGILEVNQVQGCLPTHSHAPQGSMWDSSNLLSVNDPSCIISLGEGNTPLLQATRLTQTIPSFQGKIWLKNETTNPTGSFKDRLVSSAISKALELGAKGIVCASSGNAGSSAAAYAAKAGMPAIIVVPAKTPLEKMTQIKAYGAALVRVEGHYSNTFDTASLIASELGYANLTTTFLNPYGTDALKLVGHELFTQMSHNLPDIVIVPTGSGPLIKGIVQGFWECSPNHVPRVVAVQAEGCAPIVRAFEAGSDQVHAWDTPQTIASGISDPLIGYENDGSYALSLIRQSEGLAITVSDEEIRSAMVQLATQEGVFAEPTGASSVAAAYKLIDRGIGIDKNIVCMVTGHGFKDFKVYHELPAQEFNVTAGESIDTLIGEWRDINLSSR